jgi:hypothetical protein
MREFKGDWRDLFFGFRIALDLRKMFLGLLGAIFSFAGLAVILFLGALPKSQALIDSLKEKNFFHAFYAVLHWAEDSFFVPLDRFLENPGRLALFPSTSDIQTSVWPWLVLGGALLWIVFVWSKFGGAISRITAVEIAKDERITVHESLAFAKKKFTSFFWSTVAVAVAFFFFFLVNLIGGLVGAIPYVGPVLVAVLCPFAFLGGFIMMLIAIGGIFGWPLMSPAVAAEGTDAFDAVSRAFSYIYTRPWQYLFYWIVGGFYGLFSVCFVWLFTLFLVRLSIGSAQIGMGSRLDPVIRRLFDLSGTGGSMTVPQWILLVVLGTVIMIIYGLGFSYIISFYYTIRSLMYFILRRQVDSTEMSEVFLEEETEEEFFTEDFEADEEPSAPAEEKAESGEEKKEEPSGEEEKKAGADDKPAAEGETPAEEKPEEKPEEKSGGEEEGKSGEKKD